eukprot:12899615-Alexandrium_andersonii.AAC.1
MADSPREQGQTPSRQAQWGPSTQPPRRRRMMSEGTSTERPGATLRGAPLGCVTASSPVVLR